MAETKKTYYDVNDIKEILGVAESKAYKVIRELNAELKKKGFVCVAGKVSRKFFNERYYADLGE